MAKNSIRQVQKLQQKLSHQNIQLFKMMEMNLLQFDEKVKEEMDVNPALEDIEHSNLNPNKLSLDQNFAHSENIVHTKNLENQNSNSDYSKDSQKHYGSSNHNDDDREFYIPIKDNETIIGSLNNQLSFLDLTKDQFVIAEFIVGSIDDDGYLRRTIESIIDDLSFRQNFYTTNAMVEEMLELVQELDPPGIGARDIQECLMIQLRRKKYSPAINSALTIVSDYFDDFTKKNFERICKKLKIQTNEFLVIKKIIQSLNPYPGIQVDDSLGKFIIPDFYVFKNEDELELELHTYNQPNLIISKDFVDMLLKFKAKKKKSKSDQEAQEYLSDKINKASQFITLIKERQETMVIIMKTILDLQRKYFLSGEESELKPMTLKNIADIIHYDISTVSRITSSKYVQTEFGIISLKSLFSEGLIGVDGEEISNRKIMIAIKNIINEEENKNPYSDEEIVKILEQKGYKVARRTVAKYRDNLKIPAKHQRKNSHK
jgi:RNA polymerase sigma-54 factor